MKGAAIVTLALWAAIMCACTHSPSAKPEPALLLRSWIPQNELPALTARANAGDSEASERLAMYYECAALDREKALHWWRLAAHQGHVVAAYTLGVILWDSKDSQTRAEAISWLHVADQLGSPEAREFLRQIEKEPNQ